MAHRLGVWAALLVGIASSNGHAQSNVRPGIEVLIANSVQLLQGKRVGILTNQTGINRASVNDIDLLHAAGVHLAAIFSPEHGFRGRQDKETIGDTTDAAIGLPIYSLYGARRAPTRQMLDAVDVLLVDLQDVGARPFTYVSTTLLTIQAAAVAGKRVIVLDRPNPIGGELVQGPTLQPNFHSFVGMLPIPLRHGMTLGELTKFGNDVLGIHAELDVIPATGWRRADWFDATGLPWIAPSPNMPALESATHYPGLVMLEGTNVSVGRGTPIPFQAIGAPWLDPRQVIARIGATPGVTLTATTLTPHAPGDGKYDGQEIPAIRLQVTDGYLYDPVRLTVTTLSVLKSAYRNALKFDPTAFDQRAGSDRLRTGVERNESPDRIWRDWAADIDRFIIKRRPYLLY